MDITTWADNFANSGLADLAYVPDFTTTPADTLTWPTLGTILGAGKRIVIFLDAGADQSKVSYILPEFTYIWENPFDQTDNAFPCNVGPDGSNECYKPLSRHRTHQKRSNP